MIKNFLKVAVRGLRRNKSFSVINIVGLAIGMAAAMLILLWVQNEVSYDRFYDKTDRIQAMYSRDKDNGQTVVWNRIAAQAAPEIKKNYPEVKVIMITAHDGATERKQAYEGGVDLFVAKPLNRKLNGNPASMAQPRFSRVGDRGDRGAGDVGCPGTIAAHAGASPCRGAGVHVRRRFLHQPAAQFPPPLE